MSDQKRRSDSALRRLVRNPLADTAIVILLGLVLASLFAPLLTTQDPDYSALRDAFLSPGSPDHLLGTDSAGRDLLARMLFGGRVSLLGAVLALGVGALIGIPTGLLAGYFGGWFDSATIWWNNLVQSLPGLVVLLAVRAVVGPSIWVSMAVYGVILSPGFFRVVRTAVINVRNELYVDAARVSGLSDLSIMVRHILTVVRAPAIIQASLLTGVALSIQSGLEFLGVGDNNMPSWGNILNEAFRNIYRTPMMLLWPSLAIGLTCAALVILGNGLRDALEERGTSSSSSSAAPKAPKAPKTTETATTATTRTASATPIDPDSLLDICGLSVGYGGDDNVKVVVHDVDLHVAQGEVLGLVGESGSGKTQTAFAVLGLLPGGGRVLEGSIHFKGQEMTSLPSRQLRKLRGDGFAYIPQEPMSNLDPSFRSAAS